MTLTKTSHASKGYLLLLPLLLLLSACGSAPKTSTNKSDAMKSGTQPPVHANVPVKTVSTAPALPKANSGRGGYYQDDGPGDAIPPDLESTVDPIPVVEAYSRTGNKPYKVFGKTYTPIVDATTPFKQRGIASWYGKKFHGKRTSSGEPYDMYQITAAHPILPIPSYARVTNLSNGKQVIVRINDRGPFHSSRIMDLSYTAALKLGYLGKGSSEVELERLLPEDIAKMAENRTNQIAVVPVREPVSTISNNAPVVAAKAEIERPALENLIAAQERKMQTEVAATEMAGSRAATSVAANANRAENTGSTFYLQFAAFAIRANAEASMAQLKQLLRDQAAARDLPFEIVQQGSLYRLQSGPFTTRDAANQIAQQLALGGAKPIVISR
ncbi:septal ring lytic transglycosylase RlpA family protein [Undibacterium sp. Di24W]|uniref:septal ring lytic transglycosylase RlpA family protein n=1 Tax=Undibacterium sp. Di24W TaxID=3413033 RepID=UPI003BF18A44